MPTKLRETPFPSWPTFSEEAIAAGTRVLQSGKVNYWTGVEGKAFEKEFADWVGVPYAVAMANGTVALEAALFAIKLQPGDEVIVTPRTFVASASAIVRMGGVPVFADVEADSGNISAETIKAAITDRTAAVIVVHLAGWPVDVAPMLDLAEEHGFYIIEDAAQAHGASVDGVLAGALGHLCAFSFCQDKIMTTAGEGGMVTCKDEDLWARLWTYKDHGKNYDTVFNKKHPPGFRWLHEDFGTNLRMTEVQSAVGRQALREIGGWLETRRHHGERLMSHLEQFDLIRVPRPRAGVVHSFYRFYCYIRPEKLAEGWSRDRIIEEIVALGIPAFQGSCSEIYLEKAFSKHGLQPSVPMATSREIGRNCLQFLCHSELTDREINETCAAITQVIPRATA